MRYQTFTVIFMTVNNLENRVQYNSKKLQSNFVFLKIFLSILNLYSIQLCLNEKTTVEQAAPYWKKNYFVHQMQQTVLLIKLKILEFFFNLESLCMQSTAT